MRPSWKEKFVCSRSVSIESGDLVCFSDCRAGTHVHACALKEKCCLVGNQISGEVLRCVDQASDGCTAEIGALPQVEERWVTANVCFDLDGTLHHGKGFVGAVFSVVAEALDGSQGFLFAAATDEPPWRFGSEEKEDEKWNLCKLISIDRCLGGIETYREDPLKSGRHSPAPLVVTLVVGVGDSGDNDASNRPAHLQSCCACTSQSQRNNLTSICWRIGDEETPWNALECLSDDKDLERVGLGTVSMTFITSIAAKLTKKVMKIVEFIRNRASSVVHR